MKSALTLLAALALATNALGCGVSAPSKGPLPLYDEVVTHAHQTRLPALALRSVIRLTDGDRHYDSAIQASWTAKHRVSLLHLPGDRLDVVEELAGRNLAVIRESMKVTGSYSQGIRLNGTGPLTEFLASGLSGVCFVAYKSELTEEVLVTMSSGPSSLDQEAVCEISAWAFAAQGTRLVPDPAAVGSVILVPAE